MVAGVTAITAWANLLASSAAGHRRQVLAAASGGSLTSFAVGVTSATVPAALGGNMTAALTTGTNSWNQLQSAFPAAGVTQTVAGLTIAIGPLTTDVGATITDVPTAEPRIIARSGDAVLGFSLGIALRLASEHRNLKRLRDTPPQEMRPRGTCLPATRNNVEMVSYTRACNRSDSSTYSVCRSGMASMCDGDHVCTMRAALRPVLHPANHTREPSPAYEFEHQLSTMT